eukprot:Colp12_sorted_trinity150504_noHs@15201
MARLGSMLSPKSWVKKDTLTRTNSRDSKDSHRDSLSSNAARVASNALEVRCVELNSTVEQQRELIDLLKEERDAVQQETRLKDEIINLLQAKLSKAMGQRHRPYASVASLNDERRKDAQLQLAEEALRWKSQEVAHLTGLLELSNQRLEQALISMAYYKSLYANKSPAPGFKDTQAESVKTLEKTVEELTRHNRSLAEQVEKLQQSLADASV